MSITERKSLIIYDWDDTLLPTTDIADREQKYLRKVRTVCHMAPEDMDALDTAEMAVIELLSASLEHGEVIIINHTHEKYIKLTCQKWFPYLWTFLTEHEDDIKFLSGDKYYEHYYPHMSQTNYLQMKYRPLRKEIITKYTEEPYLKILFVGDEYRDALTAQNLDKEFQYCTVKSFIVEEEPTLPTFNRQVKTLQKNIRRYLSDQSDREFSCAVRCKNMRPSQLAE